MIDRREFVRRSAVAFGLSATSEARRPLFDTLARTASPQGIG